MEKTLKCLIINTGCDDETIGFCELTETEFHFVENLFNELNKNSLYGCQPTIKIILAPNLKEVSEDYEEETGDYSHIIKRINGKRYICDDL